MSKPRRVSVYYENKTLSLYDWLTDDVYEEKQVVGFVERSAADELADALEEICVYETRERAPETIALEALAKYRGES